MFWFQGVKCRHGFFRRHNNLNTNLVVELSRDPNLASHRSLEVVHCEEGALEWNDAGVHQARRARFREEFLILAAPSELGALSRVESESAHLHRHSQFKKMDNVKPSSWLGI